MSRERKEYDRSNDEPVWSSLFLLAFGVAILLFLTAVEHQNWFSLKPATGTAAAMSYASSERNTKG